MKKRRALLLSILTLLLLVGIPTGLVIREYRHAQLNRSLVAAVKANDTAAALAALYAGAEANYPHQDSAPRPILLQWLDRMFGFHAPLKGTGPSLLAQAVQHNNTMLVKALLAKGATDVHGLIVSHQFKYSPQEPIPLLAAAAEAGNLAICQTLVEHGADVNAGESNCALKMAAERGHSDVIRWLFEQGAHLDTPEEISEYCSLMAAARSGNLESVRILLAHGADATSASRWGSVLNPAVDGGNLSIVTLLVEAGADVNIGGTEVGSPLQNAAAAGDVEIVRYLLSHGADANEGYFRSVGTPVQEAVKGGHPKVVRLLLEHGADCEKKVEAGEDTALNLAQRKGNTEIVQMLKKAGAKE